jgi:hypothetical protein
MLVVENKNADEQKEQKLTQNPTIQIVTVNILYYTLSKSIHTSLSLINMCMCA